MRTLKALLVAVLLFALAPIAEARPFRRANPPRPIVQTPARRGTPPAPAAMQTPTPAAASSCPGGRCPLPR